MEIVVTCAASGSASASAPGDAEFVEFDAGSPSGLMEALAIAVTRSREESRAIYIRGR
jgi:hypothetical protein